jgi:hypothetical protein
VADDFAEIPLVCFDADICRILDVSMTTLKRRRSARTFPIPELEAIDHRHRYGRRDVIAYLNREGRQRPALVNRKSAPRKGASRPAGAYRGAGPKSQVETGLYESSTKH